MNEKTRNNKDLLLNFSLNGILGIIGFSTIIPIKREISLDETIGSIILWPYISIIVSVLGVIIAYVSYNIFHLQPILVATLIYASIMWITGFNHLDGVIDFGDGTMVHGTFEKKINVMKDTNIGTGGIATLILISLSTIAAYASVPITYIIPTIITAEIASKIGMLTVIQYGKPTKDGIGQMFMKGLNNKLLIMTTIISMALSYFILGISGIVGIIGGIIGGLWIMYTAHKNFNCVNGDCMGTANEFSRVISIIMIIITLNLI
ncbi:MAG: adenosylcobinamide-GDP ribazoletransferase [Methanobacteriaceae archaeon]|nr:adenosylcobinamide-GDP ribazoletransferase [Methanobacteriaceae archaeon]